MSSIEAISEIEERQPRWSIRGTIDGEIETLLSSAGSTRVAQIAINNNIPQ
jgi:hypothetical protein